MQIYVALSTFFIKRWEECLLRGIGNGVNSNMQIRLYAFLPRRYLAYRNNISILPLWK